MHKLMTRKITKKKPQEMPDNMQLCTYLQQVFSRKDKSLHALSALKAKNTIYKKKMNNRQRDPAESFLAFLTELPNFVRKACPGSQAVAKSPKQTILLSVFLMECGAEQLTYLTPQTNFQNSLLSVWGQT